MKRVGTSPVLRMKATGRIALAVSVVLLSWVSYCEYNVVHHRDSPPSTDEVVQAAGYPIEKHKVQTEDGYVLTIFRIPHKKDGVEGPRPAFLLQHGLTGSSDQYVHLGPEKALGFLLADKGYDVWIGNIRGNKYNQENIHFNSDDSKFWDFSWHDMGYYDIPAVITHILNVTKQEKIYYAGHSMGSAMMMVLLTQKPEFQKKIEIVFALAPAVFLSHSYSKVFTFFCQYYSPFLLKVVGHNNLLPGFLLHFQKWFWLKCSPEHQASFLCNFLYSSCFGPTTDLNKQTLPTFFSTNPSQASLKSLAHFGQSISSGKFNAFDYGKQINMKIHGSFEAPAYELDKIETPVVIMYSDSDSIVPPDDVHTLCLRLPRVLDYYRVPLTTFNHMDFLYGSTANKLLYSKIFEFLGNSTSIQGKSVCKNGNQ